MATRTRQDLQPGRRPVRRIYRVDNLGTRRAPRWDEGPYARFRGFPRMALEDERLGNPEIDVLLVMAGFYDLRGKDFIENRPVTPFTISHFTALSERRIREVVAKLAEYGYLEVSRSSRKIHEIFWGKMPENALRRNAAWVRAPIPVILNGGRYLKPHERRMYLALIDHVYTVNGRHPGPFYASARYMAETYLRVQHSWAAKTLKSLREKKLITYLPALAGEQQAAMMITPLNLVFARYANRGPFDYPPKFEPLDFESNPPWTKLPPEYSGYRAWVNSGYEVGWNWRDFDIERNERIDIQYEEFNDWLDAEELKDYGFLEETWREEKARLAREKKEAREAQERAVRKAHLQVIEGGLAS